MFSQPWLNNIQKIFAQFIILGPFRDILNWVVPPKTVKNGQIDNFGYILLNILFSLPYPHPS